ncbi:Lipase, GDSL [Artemisia annua]|uniref:Lipase, GDSL n=1 Tax=Artemisia annua TaxID=35608 RepID=A0A2U1MVN4_ARTAN|nr:Lipase, GDSL [Artemisia annua]
MDTWYRTMGGNCEFSVKALKQMVNLKILGEEADMDETKWCKYIPNKVSVFTWRLKHGRLHVRCLLDRYGMDLDTTLCPVCNEVIESLDHYFVSCCKAKSL